MSNILIIRRVGAELYHADGQTDMQAGRQAGRQADRQTASFTNARVISMYVNSKCIYLALHYD